MPKQRRDVPWIGQRGDVYYAFWYDADERRTKSITLRTTDHVEAHVRFAAFLTDGRAIFEPERQQGLTVTAALDDYYREHVVINVVNPSREEQSIRHLKLGLGSMLLKDVDIPACRRFLEARTSGVIAAKSRNMKNRTGVKPSTVRKELSCLNAAAEHALRWKRITRAEMPVVELPPATDREADFLTHEELERALAAATGELRDFIVLAYYTASRKGAIEKLSVFQVKLAQNRIHLAKPGEKKTKKRRPVVPIHPDARATVERLVAAAKEAGRETLFSSGFRAYGRFNRLMSGLGLPEKANPHVLRHTRATHLLMDGTSIYVVAKLLGDTVETLERVYGHHSPEYLDQATTGRGRA